MKTEFRRAEVPREIRALQAFDRKVFSKTDRFPADYWKVCESWWLIVSGVRVGCCAFENSEVPKGSLYIATTGILPAMQRRGLGMLLKSWEIAYARRHGFTRMVTHSRKSNSAMIALNKRFGFRVARRIPGYYEEPSEPCVEMELLL